MSKSKSSTPVAGAPKLEAMSTKDLVWTTLVEHAGALAYHINWLLGQPAARDPRELPAQVAKLVEVIQLLDALSDTIMDMSEAAADEAYAELPTFRMEVMPTDGSES